MSVSLGEVDVSTTPCSHIASVFDGLSTEPASVPPGLVVTYAIDVDVDWNTQDDTGLPWTFVDVASDPSRIVPGAFVIAGRGSAVAVAEVVDVAPDGVVHLRQRPGPIADSVHLLRAPSS